MIRHGPNAKPGALSDWLLEVIERNQQVHAMVILLHANDTDALVETLAAKLPRTAGPHRRSPDHLIRWSVMRHSPHCHHTVSLRRGSGFSIGFGPHIQASPQPSQNMVQVFQLDSALTFRLHRSLPRTWFFPFHVDDWFVLQGSLPKHGSRF
jgi:hypothetical protein